MDRLIRLIDAARENPALAVCVGLALVAGYVLLHRRSRMQRDADEHLAVLRREKGDHYGQLRPPR